MNDTSTPAAPSAPASLPPWRTVLPIAIIGTLLSLFFTGYQFGENNNVYHIPYVLEWARLPAFSDDQFYQSLKNFISVVWPPLRLITTEANIYVVFLGAFVVSRLAAFIAIVFLFTELGLRQRRYLLLGALAAAASPWLQGVSTLGEHGLLIDYFTHSELTWPFVIGAMLCTKRGHLSWVATFTAITLSINAFVGIWLILTIPLCLLPQPARPQPREILRACLIFAVLATPISVWMLSVLLAPQEVYAFRFSEYIRAFYPQHFLIDTVFYPSITAFVGLALAGLLSTWSIENGRFWRAALLANIALLIAGAILPYVVDNKIIFDMHFLRLGGIIQFFSVLLMIAAALHRITGSDRRADWVLPGLMLAALLFNNEYRVPFLLVMLAACHPVTLLLKKTGSLRLAVAESGTSRLRAWREQPEPLLAVGALLLWMAVFMATSRQFLAIAYFTAVAVALTVYRRRDSTRTVFIIFALVLVAIAAGQQGLERRTLNAENRLQFEQGPLPMAQWLREHPIQGKLLLSSEAMQKENFQVLAKTSVWVDFKQGAAVLWAPYFYKQWSERYTAVLRLTTLQALAGYAKEHHIPYLTGRDEGRSCPAGTALVHKEGAFVLCSVAP